ncbi:MAG: PCRF domain-containing protein, partial [Eggerthellaceae bacterium]|nr:PCRF domain-containing protein [Eggerthellaceae bacterium]
MVDPKDIDAIAQRIEDARSYLHIEERTAQLERLDEQVAKPGFWDDPDQAADVTRQASSIRATLAEFDQAMELLGDCRTAIELSADDPTFEAEADSSFSQLERMLDSFEVESWFSGRFDEGDCIVNINPGSGGLEAQDWTDMLFRMYTRFCENKGWKMRVLDLARGAEMVGIERASFQVEGRFAYGMLRSEVGVHRLVRISPTDLKARRHTTFAAVDVLPVLPDNVEVDVKDSELKVDVFRSHGHGGQGVNTTDSAVRITHLPTGIVVT